MAGLTAVVLAGGQGTRLRPLTEGLPKPMLPVLNRPFLEYLLERLRVGGVEHVILALGYEPDPLVRHFGTGASVGLQIEYVVEEEPLGTSGAVRALLPRLTETFLVLNGDCLAAVDIRALVDQHTERREYATLAVHTVDDPSPFGLVVTDGEGYVTRFLEKPKGPRFPVRTINTGIYALEPEVLRFVPEGFSMFERDLFPSVLGMGIPIGTFPWEGYFSDMGTPASYLALHHDMLLGRVPSPSPDSTQPELARPDPDSSGRRVEGGVQEGRNVSIHPTATLEGSILLGDDIRIGPGVRLVGPTCLGSGCVVEKGVKIEGSVLWDGVHIGPQATLQRVVLGRDVRVGEGAVLTKGVVLGSGASVVPGARIDVS